MKQDIKGKFSMTLQGHPGILKVNGALRSEAGKSLLLKSIVIGPFVIGITKRYET